VTQDKEPSRYHKRQGNAGNDCQAYPNGMVMVVVPAEDIGRESQSQDGQYRSSDQFPFPGNNQNYDQDK